MFATGQPDDRRSPACTWQTIEQDTVAVPEALRARPPGRRRDGYVPYPNVDLAIEYVNVLEASRAYEANVTMMEVSKAMINATLAADRVRAFGRRRQDARRWSTVFRTMNPRR